MPEKVMSAADVQRDVQQTAGDHVVTDPPAVPSGSDPNRGPDGRFVAGHFASVTNALHTNRVPPELTCLQQQIDQFVNACESDEGGSLADVPARRRAQLEYRARLHRRILQLDRVLEVKGMVDRHGKLRERWLAQLGTLINTATSIDRLLGLARVPAPVESLAEYFDRIAREQENISTSETSTVNASTIDTSAQDA